MQLFTIEPGDGTAYRFVFGRLPALSPYIPFYTYLAYAEGNDALIGFPFNTSSVNFDTFARRLGTAQHTQLAGDAEYVLLVAWRVYAALVGADEEGVEKDMPAWSANWRNQIPPSLLG